MMRKAVRRPGLRRRPQLFGRVAHPAGWLHRTPTGPKLIVIALIGVVALVFRDPWVNWAMFAVLVVLGFSAGIRLKYLLPTWIYAAVLASLVLLVQWFLGTWTLGMTVAGTILACVQAALLLTLTTSVASLLETFSLIVSPLRFLGVNTEALALTASLMIRAISHISGLLGEGDRAARARGLETSVRARVVPTILRSVKYAQDTGRALDARGIVD